MGLKKRAYYKAHQISPLHTHPLYIGYSPLGEFWGLSDGLATAQLPPRAPPSRATLAWNNNNLERRNVGISGRVVVSNGSGASAGVGRLSLATLGPQQGCVVPLRKKGLENPCNT